MAVVLMGFVLVPLLVLVVGSTVERLVSLTRTRGLDRSVRARSLLASGATLVAGVAAMGAWVAVGENPASDVRVATLPALGGAVATLAGAVAELTWPHPAGTVRTASLDARRLAPSLLQRLLGLGLAASAAALVVGTLTAGPDGRSVTRSAGEASSTASPYPGATYAVPVGIALVVLAAAAWWAVRRVEARPALPGGSPELDRAVRQESQVRVLRPAATGALLTAAGLWLTLGPAVNRVTQNLRMASEDAPRSPGDWVQWLGFAGAGLGVLLALAAGVALFWVGPGLPRPARPAHPVAEAARGASGDAA